MITKYVGVFCVSCGKFNVLTTYQVERPEQLGTDCSLEGEDEYACLYCGYKCYYLDDAIAHTFSPDGAEPQYPKKR
jgi:hypothetical protein